MNIITFGSQLSSAETLGEILITVGAPPVGEPSEDDRLDAVVEFTDAIVDFMEGYVAPTGLFAHIKIK